MDNGSSADIPYYPAFQQMKINKEWHKPTNVPLIGFRGTKVLPVGTISLPIAVKSYPQQLVKEVNFVFVDCSSLYNTIIGRLTLNSWRAATFTCHLSVKFPMEYCIGEVPGNQLATRKCYLAMLRMDEQMPTMNIEERRIIIEPIKILKDIPLDVSVDTTFCTPIINFGL